MPFGMIIITLNLLKAVTKKVETDAIRETTVGVSCQREFHKPITSEPGEGKPKGE